MRPGQRNIREIENLFLDSFAAKQQVVFLDESALRHALLAAEPIDLRLGGSVGRRAGIVCVQDSAVRFGLVFEDARLGSAITLECLVTVQMIRGEIQENADVGAKLFDQLQLEAA